MNLLYAMQQCPHASAMVRGSKTYPRLRGSVRFWETVCGVIVAAEFTGLPTNYAPCSSPFFGFHIHIGESCTGNGPEPFSDTLGHFDPSNMPHPCHAGDLPPILGCNGCGFSVFLTNRFHLREVMGKTVVLHAMPDDFHTQPSGNSGEKIACGVIRSC